MARKIIKKEVDAPGVDTDVEIITDSTAVALIEPITERPTFIDLLVFPQKDASLKIIADKKVEYAKVTIAGVEDKENYNLVASHMKQMKDDRIAFENAAYANVIDPIKDKLKEYAADIDEVVEAFKSAEQDERDKKKVIDDEKIRIKKEKEEAKARAVQVRISDLVRLGGLFDGSVYTFPYDSSLLINSLQVNDFEDDEWGDFLAEVNEAYEVEQKRLEQLEADRLKQIEDDKKKALEVSAQAQQNEADNLKLTEKRRALRIKELKLAGAVLQPDDTYLFPDNPDFHLAPLSALLEMEDGPWDDLIYDIEHFVPATDPLVNDEPEETTHTFVVDNEPTMVKQFDGVAMASEFGLGDHVTDIEFENIPELDWEIIEKTLKFSGGDPYIEFPISSKLFMRVFPDDTADIARVTDVDSIANEGTIQDVLNWIIIKKPIKED